MSSWSSLTTNSGHAIPQIGLGTWQSENVGEAVTTGIKAGYRHIDLAYGYGNQARVGAALKNLIPSVVERKNLWLTSKLWNTSHRPELVEKELDETLEQLSVDYLDLYLMHWPIAFPSGKGMMPIDTSKENEVELDLDVGVTDTWRAMIGLPKSKVKAIGVSNFTKKQLEAIIEATGTVPTVNQIEAHPLLLQDDLFEYCKEKGIHVTAYSPLGHNVIGKPKLTEHPVITDIASKLKVNPGQVLIAWGIKRGYSVIPKSEDEGRIKMNFDTHKVKLSEEDYKRICALGKEEKVRFSIPYEFTPRWNINVFDEPVEKDAAHGVVLVKAWA